MYQRTMYQLRILDAPPFYKKLLTFTLDDFITFLNHAIFQQTLRPHSNSVQRHFNAFIIYSTMNSVF